METDIASMKLQLKNKKSDTEEVISSMNGEIAAEVKKLTEKPTDEVVTRRKRAEDNKKIDSYTLRIFNENEQVHYKELLETMNEYKFNKGVVGIGDNFVRSKVVNFVKQIAPDFQFINCIHDSAKLSNHCEFGVGNVVMPGVSINASTIISDHCILNTNSSLDHDCRMASFSSLAPNSVVGGNCSIGQFSYV